MSVEFLLLNIISGVESTILRANINLDACCLYRVLSRSNIMKDKRDNKYAYKLLK